MRLHQFQFPLANSTCGPSTNDKPQELVHVCGSCELIIIDTVAGVPSKVSPQQGQELRMSGIYPGKTTFLMPKAGGYVDSQSHPTF
jgi:hypothetical protein